MIKHLIFDLDGTLVDTLPEIHASILEFAQQTQQKPPTLPETRHGIGHGGRTLLCEVFGYRRESQELNDAYAQFLRIYTEMSGTLGEPYPGVLNFLARCPIPYSLVTNKPGEPTHRVLQGTGLDRFPWVSVIHGDSLPEKKPHPLPFLETCKKAQVAPSECLVIGDSAADILGAQGVGAASLAVSFGYNNREDLELLGPTGVLTQFDDLIAIIQKFRA